MTTATGIIRLAFQETDDPRPQHPDVVPPPRAPVRRPRRSLHVPVPRPQTARIGLRSRPGLLAASLALPAAWTAGMIALALAVRY